MAADLDQRLDEKRHVAGLQAHVVLHLGLLNTAEPREAICALPEVFTQV
jgi:hypothetical protein